MQFGVAATGTMAAGAEDCFRVAVGAGDVVRVRVMSAPDDSLGADVEMVAPNGKSECRQGLGNGTLDCTVHSAGTYTILVRDNDNKFAGTYRLSGMRTPGPANVPIASLPSSEPLGQTELVVSMGPESDSQALYLADTQSPRPGRRLADRPGADSLPVLSPDRRTLLYVHLDQDGRDSLRVAGAANFDGDRVLFQLPAGCVTAIRPAWNPKDAGLLAIGCRDASKHTKGVWLVRTDGSDIRAVERPNARPKIDGLAFTPDGRRLGYWASPNQGATYGRLYTVSVTGGKPQAIFPTQDPDAGRDAGLAFSPNGKHITFERLINSQFDVMLADSNGQQLTPLTVGTQLDDEPSWSPDSKWIAFRSDASTPDLPGRLVPRIWISNITGKDPRLLWSEDAPAQQRLPAWN